MEGSTKQELASMFAGDAGLKYPPILSVEQASALIQVPPKTLYDWSSRGLLLLAETGMRFGELQWLTWEDVDLKRGVLLIRPKGGWKPKTGDQRAVPILPAARRLLEALPRKTRWVVTAVPSIMYSGGDRQISERRLLAYLKRLLKQLGLVGDLHTFRHSFISHALTSGIPEAIVREWVGHLDAETIKLYTHVADDISQAAVRRLAEINHTISTEEVSDDDDSKEASSAQTQHTEENRKSA